MLMVLSVKASFKEPNFAQALLILLLVPSSVPPWSFSHLPKYAVEDADDKISMLMFSIFATLAPVP